MVADTATTDITQGPAPFIYIPLWQQHWPEVWLHVKTAGEAAAALLIVQEALAALDPEVPTIRTETGDQRYARSLASSRTNATVATGLAAVVVLVTLIGVYGVMTYVISIRRREMGIRIAVGATTRQLQAQVVSEGLQLAGFGILSGVIMALASGRILAATLFGIRARDPLTLCGVAVLLLIASAAACWIPARRAAAVDPVAVLKTE